MGRTIDSDYTAQELSIKLLELMNEKEYSHISISNITTRAGVNRTTFYLFFGSKDELFAELCQTMLHSVYSEYFVATMHDDKKEREAFHAVMEFVTTWKHALKQIVSVQTEFGSGSILLSESLELLFMSEDIIARLKIKPGKYYNFFAKLYSSAIISAIEWILDNDCSEDDFYEFVKGIKLHGMYAVLKNK